MTSVWSVKTSFYFCTQAGRSQQVNSLFIVYKQKQTIDLSMVVFCLFIHYEHLYSMNGKFQTSITLLVDVMTIDGRFFLIKYSISKMIYFLFYGHFNLCKG